MPGAVVASETLMNRLEVEAFGPIKKADVSFGDLTVLVGPPASGKSLFVQLLKAVEDAGAIRKDLRDYGFDWSRGRNPAADYCELYFGGGLQGLSQRQPLIRRDGRSVNFKSIWLPGGQGMHKETTYLIPAQRGLPLEDGWPRPFMGYPVGAPYALRRFSDSLRLLMENELGASEGTTLFPRERGLEGDLLTVLDDTIYLGAKLMIETEGLRKRIMLVPRKGAPALPYLAWSGGQRAFTPLLLGLFLLLPTARSLRSRSWRSVIIEEPEMGLHPQAILSFGLLALELLAHGYQVVLSTHSPGILDLVWAIGELKRIPPKSVVSHLGDLLGIQHPSRKMKHNLEVALTKELRTYCFERRPRGTVTRDITSLDTGVRGPVNRLALI
jgi:hypothetical protein